MKLLTPSQVQDTRAQELARSAMRSKELNDASDKARKRLADAEGDFSKVLAGQRLRWAKEEEEHTEIIAKRERELKLLEEKRKKALEPIESIQRAAQDALSNAQNATESALRRESDAEALSERLQDKLDAVGQREIDVVIREQRSKAKELNLKAQQEVADMNTKLANKGLGELISKRSAFEAEMAKLRTALTLQERSLDAKAEKLSAKEAKLEILARQLQDQRETLERAFIRIQEGKKRA